MLTYHILQIVRDRNVLWVHGEANSNLLENLRGLPTPLISEKKMCSRA